MGKNKVKELSYYTFFAIMILAKGIGLDSGDKLYYLLSGVACISVALKIILTKYNKNQILAMVLLCTIAFVAYRNSGRMGILLTTLTIIGMKDIEVGKLFRIGAIIYSLSFIGTVMAAGLGFIPNPLVVHEKGNLGEMIRWGMGYSTGNVFHESYFILVALLGYTWGEKYNIKRAAGLMFGNLLVFLFSLSYTGIAVTTFYIIINLYAVKRKTLSRPEKYISQLFLPVCLIISFIFPLLLHYPFIQKLDSMMQARLSFCQYYLLNQPITLFGTRTHNVPYFWVIMDNGYVYYFITFGIIAFIIFCLGYFILIARCSGLCSGKSRRNEDRDPISDTDLPALAMIFSFLLYGIMEQFISNAFMNVSLLFMGGILFEQREKEQVLQLREPSRLKALYDSLINELEKKKKLIWGVGIIGGILGLVCYISITTQPQYVEIPIKSLLSIDAQSAIIYVTNEEGTKDSLKEEMEAYKTLIEDETLIQKVLLDTDLNEKISPKQVLAALEYSLPQSVHNSKVYNSFRIRLLKLYSGVSNDEYDLILNNIIYILQNQCPSKITAIGDVYSERIYKDAGSDRIEHINNDKNYVVEKAGNIVRIEYARGCILSILFTVIIAEIIWFMWMVIKSEEVKLLFHNSKI